MWEADGGEVVGVMKLTGEEPVLKERVYDARCPSKAVLHGIQDLALLPSSQNLSHHWGLLLHHA